MLDKRPWSSNCTRQAAVFVCPSIYEPFGIINLEAMACETAVVASAVGGIKEVVVHGETGFLVPLEQMTESPFEPVKPDRFARDLATPGQRVDGRSGHAGAVWLKRVADAPRSNLAGAAIAKQTARLYESLKVGGAA